MYLNLKSPLAFFDLETTGTNISHDRIVEISIVKAMPDGTKDIKTMKLNPEMPIPEEVSLIHGIRDEDVKDAPTFKQVAKELAKFLEGADLAGYNIVKFDVPVLVEEFLRADIDFDLSNRKLVDAQKIFFMMEKRTLSAAYKFYCDKTLDGAHSAEADTLATFDVLNAQLERYEGMEVEDLLGKKIGVLENDMDKIHALTNKKMVDLAGRIVFNNKGEEVFNFGKHRGKLVSDVLKKEPGYYDWMMRGDFPLDTKRKLTQIKLRDFNKK
ncbi:3'-5' exonuclease [Mangrovivirga cuniculi]|uniref:DNA polymerase III subunit epsilon n=1 Tax=Mangrovivirga cuniculi TaxID=2715131 RepID=A0A4D7JUW1_9BACT|nr:3'-5' exonuclease [Mangrovivirga cuniculi]QCK15966.1 DNA polymerase III subunit epsilon [Mangrovivirga cuniculi]